MGGFTVRVFAKLSLVGWSGLVLGACVSGEIDDPVAEDPFPPMFTAPFQTRSVPSTYVGADGPRGVGVAPQGIGGLEADFRDSESLALGVTPGDIDDLFDWEPGHAASLGYSASDPLGAIGAYYAHAQGWTGEGVVVAVVDGGIDTDHPDLDGKVIGGLDLTDGDFDVHPIVEDCVGGCSHGTHVAGIIAGARNGTGTQGVAYGADLYNIRIFGDSGFFSAGTDADFAYAINAAVAMDVRIFNNSWGSTSGDEVVSSFVTEGKTAEAIDAAIDKGAVFVWASGNDHWFLPALLYGDFLVNDHARAPEIKPEWIDNWVNVVNVTETEPGNGEWRISNSDGEVWRDASSNTCGVTMDYCLAAPGSLIESSVTVGDPAEGDNATHGYKSGTSMAAPMVSGALAVLFQAFPYMESERIVDLMFHTATDLGESGVDAVYGHGMVNLENAMTFQGTVPLISSSSTVTGARVALADSRASLSASLASSVIEESANLVVLDDFDRAYAFDARNLVEARNGLRQRDGSAGWQENRFGATLLNVGTELIWESRAGLSDASDLPMGVLLQSEQVALGVETDALLWSGALDRSELPEFHTRGSVMQSAYVDLAEVDAGASFSWGDADASVKVQAFVGQADEATGESSSFKGAGGLLVYDRALSDGSSFAFYAGVLDEDDSLLGMKNQGAFSLSADTQTRFIGVSGVQALGGAWGLYARAEVGQSQTAQSVGSLFHGVTDLVSGSAALGLVAQGLARQGDSLTLAFAQDLSIQSGSASLTVPVGRDTGGVVLQSTTQLDLGEAPPLLLQTAYQSEIADSLSWRFAFEASQAGQDISSVIYSGVQLEL